MVRPKPIRRRPTGGVWAAKSMNSAASAVPPPVRHYGATLSTLQAALPDAREWRNRQTRTVQVRVPERAWGFNSPLAHVFVWIRTDYVTSTPFQNAT
jgi:hypothetical protein